ncbi:peptidoglycan D,D-transpeptidase FtsI family protein [Paraferrimonas sedimenticola]|uniref:Peptidoglycan D,D-transpeptidase FtsI n=1 Tax=Paraferrimonas sedimenticola TaxID=375674 RepID=A0AA37RXH7_9GAMM|nr:penicillin-binding transpeptidase domain-containing protein [Paraferrimonas sedimenticola]GLP97505.1 peptidoglycan glycosyltransferase FtsI [Paraferrimonas sedimenticola]
MSRQARSKLKPQVIPWRLYTVAGCIAMLFFGLTVRAAYLQVIEPEMLRKQSDMRSLRTTSQQVQRGLITDRNGEMLAVSVPVQAVWADPKVVFERNGFEDMRRWQALADVLNQPLDPLLKRVQRDPKKRFVYLRRQVTPAVAEYVRQLKIRGIYLKPESRRYYPTGEIASQLVGITNIDDKGIEGIEKAYNDWLTGSPQKQRVRKDRNGHVVERLSVVQQGEHPNDLVLSVDQRIQSLAYSELKRATESTQATSGSVVVLDIKTGEVLAMVNTPSFNPNSTSQRQSYRMRNRAITDTYEPGSTIKPFVVVAGLEAGVIKKDEIVSTSPGYMRLGGSLVRDSQNYGDMNLAKMLVKSSNVGISKVALAMPVQQLLGTYYSMGLGNYSGIHLAGESSGVIHERNRWSEHERATLSFGYGFSVTALQMAQLYATLANDGLKMPVSILKLPEVDGQIQLPAGEQVIAPDVARTVRSMLVGVTEPGGTARKAHIEGYPVAGKTGTSRKAVAGGYGDDYVASFVGVAPANQPELAIAVVINEPKGDQYYGGDAAAPVFAKVMSGALQMRNVEPVTNREKRLQLAGLQERAR